MFRQSPFSPGSKHWQDYDVFMKKRAQDSCPPLGRFGAASLAPMSMWEASSNTLILRSLFFCNENRRVTRCVYDDWLGGCMQGCRGRTMHHSASRGRKGEAPSVPIFVRGTIYIPRVARHLGAGVGLEDSPRAAQGGRKAVAWVNRAHEETHALSIVLPPIYILPVRE